MKNNKKDIDSVCEKLLYDYIKNHAEDILRWDTPTNTSDADIEKSIYKPAFSSLQKYEDSLLCKEENLSDDDNDIISRIAKNILPYQTV